MILHQVSQTGALVEATINQYENDLTRIIYRNINEIYTIFHDEEAMRYIITDLEGFYSKYRDMVASISVYDNKNDFLGLYINDADEFVIDTFSRQQDNKIESRDVIKSRGSTYYSYFPFFENNKTEGNVVVEIDLNKYLSSVLRLFNLENIQWMFLINENGEIIFSSDDKINEMTEIRAIADSISIESEGMIQNKLILPEGSKELISAYYSLNMLKNDLGLVFTRNIDDSMNTFLNRNAIRGFINLAVFIALFVIVFIKVRKDDRAMLQYQSKILELKMILEHFPIGIMVRDKKGIIHIINRAGQRLLFTDKDEDLTGKNFDEKFLVTNKYLLDENASTPFDADHFMHYTRDGNEIVVYLRDEIKHIAGEEYTLSALIDVSPFEKSRKQEAAANKTKSDFLAKMSHEIRTPMNGIIGMVENLLVSDLSDENKEQVKIIRKSAELLMAIINDVLDLSKIEAGKMMIEEIPFSLSEELKISTELFKPLADEKDIALIVRVKKDVPDHLIGDPFRIRQVISNLLSNAVKFTKEGQIKVSVELIEKANHSLSLLFSVEDTGIGIPADRIRTIFSSYDQGGGSTSRKFGGTGLGMTISKQLVEMMNGEIFVESPSSISTREEYPGTKFSFTIDLHSDEKLKKSYEYGSIKNLNQVSALILSRKKDATDNIHRVLDDFGISYKYREYDDNSIDSVVYHLEEKRDLYKILFIKDKPEQDGFGLAMQLKENGISGKFPVVMISSNDRPGNYKRCKSLGIDYYLIQPYDTHEVYKILKATFPNVDNLVEQSGAINKIKSNIRILVAEDNILNQRVVQGMFKHLGYEIDLANNGNEALEMLEEKPYDLIFMDLLMPEKDGLTATREIRAKGLKTTIIAMTASEDQESRDEAFASGMNDYTIKPITLETVKRFLIKWFSETL